MSLVTFGFANSARTDKLSNRRCPAPVISEIVAGAGGATLFLKKVYPMIDNRKQLSGLDKIR